MHMMENCFDFANEMSQLEFVCKSLGGRAVITTKFHAEYAGEGVEYSWGFDNFDKLVDKGISVKEQGVTC